MEISDGVIGAILGALTGAGGLGGILTLVGKSRDADAAVVRQYYDKITSRLDVLESRNSVLEARVDHLTDENVALRADVARLTNENADLHAENQSFRQRFRDLDEASEITFG